MEGQMYKWGTIFTRWRPRYFKLKDGILNYYIKENGELRGKLQIQGCEIKEVPEDSLQIHIDTGKKVMQLKVKNVSEKMKWLSALKLEKFQFSGSERKITGISAITESVILQQNDNNTSAYISPNNNNFNINSNTNKQDLNKSCNSPELLSEINQLKNLIPKEQQNKFTTLSSLLFKQENLMSSRDKMKLEDLSTLINDKITDIWNGTQLFDQFLQLFLNTIEKDEILRKHIQTDIIRKLKQFGNSLINLTVNCLKLLEQQRKFQQQVSKKLKKKLEKTGEDYHGNNQQSNSKESSTNQLNWSEKLKLNGQDQNNISITKQEIESLQSPFSMDKDLTKLFAENQILEKTIQNIKKYSSLNEPETVNITKFDEKKEFIENKSLDSDYQSFSNSFSSSKQTRIIQTRKSAKSKSKSKKNEVKPNKHPQIQQLKANQPVKKKKEEILLMQFEQSQQTYNSENSSAMMQSFGGNNNYYFQKNNNEYEQQNIQKKEIILPLPKHNNEDQDNNMHHLINNNNVHSLVNNNNMHPLVNNNNMHSLVKNNNSFLFQLQQTRPNYYEKLILLSEQNPKQFVINLYILILFHRNQQHRPRFTKLYNFQNTLKMLIKNYRLMILNPKKQIEQSLFKNKQEEIFQLQIYLQLFHFLQVFYNILLQNLITVIYQTKPILFHFRLELEWVTSPHFIYNI